MNLTLANQRSLMCSCSKAIQILTKIAIRLTITQFFPMCTKEPTCAALTTQSSSMIT